MASGGPIGHAHAKSYFCQRTDQHAPDTKKDQPLRREVSKQKDDATADRVGEQDVAEPQNVRMQQSKQRQQSHAPIVQSGKSLTGLCLLVVHQGDASAEQNREQADEFAIGYQLAGKPRVLVPEIQCAQCLGIRVGGHNQRKPLHIHNQNAK